MAEGGAPAMSMAVSSPMGSVKASSIFLQMKQMMVSATVSRPCSMPPSMLAFAIVYPARMPCTTAARISQISQGERAGWGWRLSSWAHLCICMRCQRAGVYGRQVAVRYPAAAACLPWGLGVRATPLSDVI